MPSRRHTFILAIAATLPLNVATHQTAAVHNDEASEDTCVDDGTADSGNSCDQHHSLLQVAGAATVDVQASRSAMKIFASERASAITSAMLAQTSLSALYVSKLKGGNTWALMSFCLLPPLLICLLILGMARLHTENGRLEGPEWRSPGERLLGAPVSNSSSVTLSVPGSRQSMPVKACSWGNLEYAPCLDPTNAHNDLDVTQPVDSSSSSIKTVRGGQVLKLEGSVLTKPQQLTVKVRNCTNGTVCAKAEIHEADPNTAGELAAHGILVEIPPRTARTYIDTADLHEKKQRVIQVLPWGQHPDPSADPVAVIRQTGQGFEIFQGGRVTMKVPLNNTGHITELLFAGPPTPPLVTFVAEGQEVIFSLSRHLDNMNLAITLSICLAVLKLGGRPGQSGLRVPIPKMAQHLAEQGPSFKAGR